MENACSVLLGVGMDKLSRGQGCVRLEYIGTSEGGPTGLGRWTATGQGRRSRPTGIRVKGGTSAVIKGGTVYIEALVYIKT